MKLIVGLGNPGTKYSATRHNIGKRVVEAFGQVRQARWQNRKNLHAVTATLDWDDQPLTLACTDTYMNLSGKAVKALTDELEIQVEKNLLIIVDEAALPFGRLRLRAKGSDGGHNGLKSVEEALSSQLYARLRIGIGPAAEEGDPAVPVESLEAYVLSPFTKQEQSQMGALIKEGVHACGLWISQPIESAMNVVNAIHI